MVLPMTFRDKIAATIAIALSIPLLAVSIAAFFDEAFGLRLLTFSP